MTWYLLGWLATSVYLGAQAYIALIKEYRKGLFLGANIAGAAMLAVASYGIGSQQAVVINIYWAIVSAFALLGKPRELPTYFPRWLLSALLIPFGFVTLAMLIAASTPRMAANITGWCGTVLYCAAYCCIAMRVISRENYLRSTIAAGAALMPAYAFHTNWPSLTLNGTWIVISAAGLYAPYLKSLIAELRVAECG